MIKYKKNNPTLFFISINPFGYIPVFRHIINHFSNWNLRLLSNYVKGNYSFSNIANEKFVKIYDHVAYLSNPSIVDQFNRYFTINLNILSFLIHNKKSSVLYTIDYQVLSLIFWWKRLFPSKNVKVIYHQIEVVDPALCQGMNLLLFKYFRKNIFKLDLSIFPEINRLKYFISITNVNESRTMIFPNTCLAIKNKISIRHSIIEKIPKESFVIGHIGNMGINYSFEYLSVVSELAQNNVYFIFIGRQLPEIENHLRDLSANNRNIIYYQEVPHTDLHKIYPFIHLGVILYKGVDINNEFCAPNKLYEYWSYGIPVVAHQLKGLTKLFHNHCQGQLINMSDTEIIKETLMQYIIKGPSDRSVLIDLFENKYALHKFIPILDNQINALLTT